MTLEEKVQNLQRVSMKEARSEGNALIKGHADFLSQQIVGTSAENEDAGREQDRE